MKKTLFFASLLAMVMAFGMASCGDSEGTLEYIEREKDDDDDPGATDKKPGEGNYTGIPQLKPFSVDITEIADVPAEGNGAGEVITVTAAEDIEWTVDIAPADIWLTANPSSGKGDGTFTLQVLPTPDNERKATVTVRTVSEEVEPAFFDIAVTQLPNSDVPDLSYNIASLDNVQNPSVAEENGVYYVFSSNLALPPAAYEPGLMLRTSTDLINYTFKGYVLSRTFESAKTKLMAIAPAVDGNAVRMAAPHIVKVNDEWRLYYTVFVDQWSASLIGYATTKSLANQEWIDRGVVVSGTGGGDGILKYCYPSFIESEGRHFLTYGYAGVDIVELDKQTGKPAGAATVLFRDNVGGAANIVEMNGGYYMYICMLQPWNSSSIRVAKSTTGSLFGPYNNFAQSGWVPANIFITSNRTATNLNYFGYRHNGGMDFIRKDGKWLVLHHAQKGTALNNEDSDGIFRLQTRQVSFLTEEGFPSASLEIYRNEPQAMAESEIVGKWLYATMWGWEFNVGGGVGYYNFVPNIPFTFYADHTLKGLEGENELTGTWSFNASANQIRFIVNEWGAGETIAAIVSKTGNADNLDGSGLATRYSAHGYNISTFDKSAALMRKTSNTVE